MYRQPFRGRSRAENGERVARDDRPPVEAVSPGDRLVGAGLCGVLAGDGQAAFFGVVQLHSLGASPGRVNDHAPATFPGLVRAVVDE
jgi:hypothetical protein